MAQPTAISWSDVTWNPTHGCSIVSTECKFCYAQTLSLRYRQTLKPWTPANAPENVLLKPHKLREPFSQSKVWRGLGDAARAAGKTDGKLVFVNSMSDLFHPQVPFEFVDEVYDVMAQCPQHVFQILTKRPDRMREFFTATEDTPEVPEEERAYLRPPLPNVWLGTSIGLRHFVRRADELRATPATVRFLSAEPLLGPLVGDAIDMAIVPVTGERRMEGRVWSDGFTGPELDLTGIDWVIVGGESGAGHRPMRASWAFDLLAAARNAGSAFFMKQKGGARPGGALDELPEGLRVREFPSVAVVA